MAGAAVTISLDGLDQIEGAIRRLVHTVGTIDPLLRMRARNCLLTCESALRSRYRRGYAVGGARKSEALQ